MRIEKQKYSDQWPYDQGWAIFTGDTQTGWFKDKDRAEERIKSGV